MEQTSTRGKTALRVILNTLLIIGGLVVGFFLLLMLIFAHPREQAVGCGVSLGVYYAEQAAPTGNTRWIQKDGNFIFTSDENGAVITGYLGSEEAVVIPDVLGGQPVVSIANHAFSSQKYSGTSQLRTVTFPDTVTYIGVGAFQGRSKLERIIFSPDSRLRWIDNSAFFDCPALTDVQLPGQVERIGHEAFGYCTSLTSFHIPASVTQIEVNPFPYCKALTSITVDPANESFTVVDGMLIDKRPREILQDDPNTVKTGLICLLSYPGGLTETQLTIPEGVTEIRQKAFFWCESLQSVVLPQSLQAIGASAFYGCTSLEQVNLPAGLLHITTDPFGQRQESFTVTVTPYSCGEDWAIRYDVPMKPVFSLTDYARFMADFPMDRVMQPISSAEDAKAAAEAIWLEVYGDTVLDEKPYRVYRDEASAAWLIMGTLNQPEDASVIQGDTKMIKLHFGGVANCILQDDGQVLAVWHEK